MFDWNHRVFSRIVFRRSRIRGDAIRVFETTCLINLVLLLITFFFLYAWRSVNYCHRFFFREALEAFLETSKQRNIVFVIV